MMPEPNRLTCLVDKELAGAPLELLIEQDAVIALECHACHHEAFWRADDLRRKFPHRAGLTFGLIGPRLRCSQCRSEWLQVVQMRGNRANALNQRSPA
jgi:hypothetical protein